MVYGGDRHRFSGVFSLTGDFGGQAFTYDVNYTGTIGADTGTVANPIAFGRLVAGVGVPEPTTWGLMILGFGAVGGALRRRSTKVAYAACIEGQGISN